MDRIEYTNSSSVKSDKNLQFFNFYNIEKDSLTDGKIR